MITCTQIAQTNARRVALCVGWITLFLVSTPAVAQTSPPRLGDEPRTSAAIFNLNADPAHRELAATLVTTVVETLKASPRYAGVAHVSMEVTEVSLLLNCSNESRACLRSIAGEVGARLLVFGELRSQKNELQLQLTVFDAGRGEVLSQFSKTVPMSTERPFTDDVIAFLGAEHTAESRVQVGSSVVGAEVAIDGRVVGVAPMERKGLAPGPHTVRVRHPDYDDWETTFDVQPGGSYELWAQLAPTHTGVIVAPEVVVRKKRPNWIAWSIVGIGGASAAGSLVAGRMLVGTERTLSRESSGGTLTYARFSALHARGRAEGKVHLVTLGVAVVGLTVGGSMLLIDALSKNGEDEKPPEAARAKVAVGPAGVAATIVW